MQRIPVHELYANPKVTQKLLEDNAWNVETWLGNKIGDKFGRVWANAFVVGKVFKLGFRPSGKRYKRVMIPWEKRCQRRPNAPALPRRRSLRRSEIIAIGAGLGWPPSVTYEQTLWEIVAAIEGHNRVQCGEEKLEPPSDAQFDALLDEHLPGRAS